MLMSILSVVEKQSRQVFIVKRMLFDRCVSKERNDLHENNENYIHDLMRMFQENITV